ncbi:unnamed protein product (macronuclear) [Paramecium tetraurelia]|uniref:THIF-type NAD/FAD binding fold domain-containing protein n=1 Tax=Paramecium tetraurelia TaxID=5888 RepID=A0DI54_PARTE|nr:uncharacterized protein GSPATT00017092001 [Paramecium tetraurelia]CAK82721.1 unnamed protein product [Paramecium tetraurelia]|eukprot:XP_001450118.1 hypothetical protein (macronuclear) [Paramecium tetraurelia strain d4-2]
MAEHIPEERALTEEERQKYDRAGFIGHQVQKRLLASNILIVNMTGSNTELAKNLILAGANITIVDNEIINERDTDTNFIFTKQLLGQKRGQIAQEELKLINPLVKIDWLQEFPTPDKLIKHNGIVTSTTDFEEMIKYDKLSREINIPYYNLVCCGHYGFMYIGLGSKFTYEREKKVVMQIVFGKKLQEQDRYREFEEVIAHSVPLEETLNYNYKPQGMLINTIYYCLLMMKKAQEIPELKAYDPYQPNDELLDKFTQIGKDIYKAANGKDATEEQANTFRDFARLYGIDYCPVYSVVGSVASQELIISTSRINEPALNWFCYDSVQSYGQVEVIQDVSSFKVRDLPERKQLVPKE